MRYCRCVFEEKTLSEPDEPRGLVTCERDKEEDGFRKRKQLWETLELCRRNTRRQPEDRRAHLRQQQEVVEQEAVQLLAALGFKQLPAVEELPGTQTVGDGVKHQLLKDRERTVIIFYWQMNNWVSKMSNIMIKVTSSIKWLIWWMNVWRVDSVCSCYFVAVRILTQPTLSKLNID